MEGKIWNKAQSFVDAANILNRTQEHIIRRAVFQETLRHEMRNRGKDLPMIIKNGQLGAIPQDAIEASVKKSLDVTFAVTPGRETFARDVINAVNKNPIAKVLLPFPRFMANALKFTYEFSPMGFLSFVSKAERAAFRAGDVRKISKAAIGTAFTYAGYDIRNSEFADEKWYELNLPNGEVVDARPFAPFSTFLFTGDLVKRFVEGTMSQLTSADIIQGIAASNFRAGTGSKIVDEFLTFVDEGLDGDFSFETLLSAQGNLLAGFLTFMSPLRDAYDQYTDGQAIVRDTKGEPFLGPIKAKLPFFSQTLPEAEFPTRAGPKFFVDPVKRQATGLSVKGEKNAVEKELDRLGFKRREILSGSGDKDIDRETARVMGPVVELIMVPLAESKTYQAMSDGLKGLILSEVLAEIRAQVRKHVNEFLPPEKQLEVKFNNLSRRTRDFLKEVGIEKAFKAGEK